MKQIVIRILAACMLLASAAYLFACTKPSSNPETEAPTEEQTSDASTTEPAWESDPMDFSVLDAEGKTVKLSDFYGKPIVLNFWASWCPPCKAELPDFEAAYKKYDGKVTFLMVNLTDNRQETVEVAKSFVESQGYTFPVYFDTTYEAAYKYGVRSIPQTYFIDAEGNVVAKATGMISGNQLEEGIGKIYRE